MKARCRTDSPLVMPCADALWQKHTEWRGAGTNLLIAAGWLWLHWPVLMWLVRTLMRPDTRLNLVLLIAAAALLGARTIQQLYTCGWRISAAPVMAWPALMLTLGSASAYVVIEYLWNVHILSATLFGLGTYGLISLYYPNRSLPAALLLIAVLPFGSYLDVYVGFPARLLTANAVQQLLAALHIASTSAETVLVLENGIAHIDLPCSGVQSLWTGLLFFLAATCCERPCLDSRWVATGGLLAAALLVANATRVAVLVMVTLVARLPRLAELMHVPLGILGFVGCCAMTLAVLRATATTAPPPQTAGAVHPVPWGLQPALVAAIAFLGLLYAPSPLPTTHTAGLAISLPPSLASENVPLTEQEADFFTRHGPVQAERRRFHWNGLSGSLLLAFSTSWRGHHNPEHCLAGNGLKVGARHTVLVAPDFPLRAVTLEDGAASAAYWFQSPLRTTDEIAARIWADLTGTERRWVLVSIVFDGAADPMATQTQTLFTLIHAAVAAALKGGST